MFQMMGIKNLSVKDFKIMKKLYIRNMVKTDFNLLIKINHCIKLLNYNFCVNFFD